MNLSSQILMILGTVAVLRLTNCEELQKGNDCSVGLGMCLQASDCSRQGGKILGHCNETDQNICCDFSETIQDSCNAIKEGVPTSHFKSPGYPEFYGGSLVCHFQLNLDKSTVGVKLDFIDLKLPGNYRVLRNVTKDDSKFQCDSDWFFIKGFPNWMPDPRCGDLSGYSTIMEIDKERYQRQVTIVFIMSSDRYRWNIKLTQISFNKARKMEYCLATRMESWNKQIGQEYIYKPVNHNYPYENNPPWQVSIRLMPFGTAISTSKNASESSKLIPPEGSHLCTGMIIDNRHVLTSSSCFLKGAYGSPKYRVKSLKIRTQNATLYEMETLTFHCNFGLWPFIHDDIAMIRTKISIPFDKDVRPIDIPQEDTASTGMSTMILPGCIEKMQETAMFSVLNQTKCSEARMKELESLDLNATEMESIGKYEGVVKDWICVHYRERIVEIGCPLVQLDSKGKNPFVIGMFSHSAQLSKTTNPIGDGDLETSDTKYFTKIHNFRKWILMAIS